MEGKSILMLILAIISAAASVLGVLLIRSKVIQKRKHVQKQSIKGNHNIQAGRDIKLNEED